jgi:hypothetical protein
LNIVKLERICFFSSFDQIPQNPMRLLQDAHGSLRRA